MKNNLNLLPIEQYCEILNRQVGTYNIIICSRLKGHFTREIIRQSLDIIQSRHPRLNWRIVEEQDCLQFKTEGAQKIPLQVMDKLHDKYWHEIVTAQINTEIESDKCLMRAVLISALDEKDSNYLITTVHHAIADGLSFVQLQSEILSYCQKIAAGETITPVMPLPILPSLKELLADSTATSRLDESYPEKDTLGFEKWVPIKSRKTAYIYKYLDEQLTQQLKKVARKEKTTVYGAFCAAMLLATARIIRANKKIEVVRASCATMFDLRPYLKFTVSNEHLNLLAWDATSWHTLETNTLFWDLSREVREHLRSLLKSRAFISEIISEKFGDYIDCLSEEVQTTVDLSNLGKLNIPTVYGTFELEEIHIVCGTAAFGGMATLISSEFRGKTLLSFLFSEPSVSQTTMEILANNVVSNLSEACY
jgi:NRPS condensation-like uncharacterized protein